MKRIFKKLVSIIALCTVAILNAATTPVVSYFKARPQSFNGARKVSGEVPGYRHVHLYDMQEWYGTFWATPEYTRSFRPGRIAGCLFGDDLTSGDKDCRTIKVQGSEVPNRDAKAWLADYFYLPENFNGTVAFEPRISNFILDFNFYLGLDPWFSGGYLRVYSPFVHTRWDLNFKETTLAGTGGTMSAGKFSPVLINNVDLLKSAASFFRGDAPTNPLKQTVGMGEFSTERRALQFAKMSGTTCKSDCTGRRTENGFGDVRAEFGWNFWQKENAHFGLNIQTAVPTGDRPQAEFLFDAVVGNGKHWELGGGATFHYMFWSNATEDHRVGFYTDLNITHLFGAVQQRTFDLKNKPLSRYMLASQFAELQNGLKGAIGEDLTGKDIELQFNGVFEPVANLTTQEVKVTVGAQVDLTAWFNYSWRGFSWDLGYNFWYSGCERIRCRDKCPSSRLRSENTWALKGDAHMFGFVAGMNPREIDNENDELGNLMLNQPIALSATQSGATINKGTNQGITKNSTANPAGSPVTNPGVDFVRFATAQDINDAGNGDEVRLHSEMGVDEGGSGANRNALRIQTSFLPVFITENDIDFKQRSRGLSHKIFSHFSYTWDRDGWVPYLGSGFEAEFGKTESRNKSDCCPTETTTKCPKDCIDCAVSQWGIWLKVGFSFS